MKRIFYTTIMLCSSVVLCMEQSDPLHYLQTTKDDIEVMCKKMHNRCFFQNDLINILNSDVKEGRNIGLLALFIFLPDNEIRQNILMYATQKSFQWASLFAWKRKSFNYHRDFFKNTLGIKDFAQKIWPSYHCLKGRLKRRQIPLYDGNECVFNDEIAYGRRDLVMSFRDGRNRVNKKTIETLEGKYNQADENFKKNISLSDLIHFSKDASFSVVISYDNKYTCNVRWINEGYPSVILLSCDLSCEKPGVCLSPYDTECLIRTNNDIGHYAIQRINHHSLDSMKMHNAFRWLVDFREFEQQAFPELINIDHEFNLSEEKRSHLIDYAQYYADRTDMFLENKKV